MFNSVNVRVAIRVDVLMRRHRAVLVTAEQTGKHRADGQEHEKADDDAVPLHDPEQGA